LVVVFGLREVLQHQGDAGVPAQLFQEDRVVEAAGAGADFVEMRRQLLLQEDVFGVAALDVGAELLEALADQAAAVVAAADCTPSSRGPGARRTACGRLP
jgi:hypothetical protein